MKILLCGLRDLEDGGYMSPIGFKVPDGLETYQEMFDHLMKTTTFLPAFVKQFGEVYNDELETEVTLEADDVELSWGCGSITMKCILLAADDEEDWEKDQEISVDTLEVIEE